MTAIRALRRAVKCDGDAIANRRKQACFGSLSPSPVGLRLNTAAEKVSRGGSLLRGYGGEKSLISQIQTLSLKLRTELVTLPRLSSSAEANKVLTMCNYSVYS